MQVERKALIQDLGGGLIIRHITPADSAELCRFNAETQADPGMPPEDAIGVWTDDLINNPPPTVTIDDIIVVEDTHTGRIVSSVILLPQTWRYAGIPIGVGQVEIVSTHPDYRRRGLVRRQFEIVHRWSEERGHLVQSVSGIPWYYRQFGYEMCVTDGGGRTGFLVHIPQREKGEDEPYRIRPATGSDAAFLTGVADQAAARYLLTSVRDAAQWRYEIDGRSPASLVRREVRIIETAAGEPAGYLLHASSLLQGFITVTGYELAPGISWTEVTPTVLRYLGDTGDQYARRAAGGPFQGFRFGLESDHPVYHAIPTRLPQQGRLGAWFIRVADISRFLMHVAPVLEQRLAASSANGFTGDLKLNFYRSGKRLRFERGRLTAVEPWPDNDYRSAGASFPDLTFLQLLFGYRSLDDLEYAFPDCFARNEQARVLLGILFPKQATQVWQVS